MTTPDPEERIAQILLALDAASHDLASVESAVMLAARLQVELLGLFVEDADLLRIAGLPFAREVALSTAVDRALGGGGLERSLRALAGEAERSLAEAAGRAQVKWSFRTVRGRRLQSALTEAGATDLLLLGRSVRGRWLRQDTGPTAHTVYLVFDGSRQSTKAAGVVAKLGSGNGTDVVVLDVAPAQSSPSAQEITRELREAGLSAHARRLQGSDIATVLDKVRKPAPALLVLPAGSTFLESVGTLEPLLQRLDCPLLVVR